MARARGPSLLYLFGSSYYLPIHQQHLDQYSTTVHSSYNIYSNTIDSKYGLDNPINHELITDRHLTAFLKTLSHKTFLHQENLHQISRYHEFRMYTTHMATCLMLTILQTRPFKMSTSAEITSGVITVSSGKKGAAARLLKLKISCDLNDTAHYGVPLALFSNRNGSISTTFPNIVRLEVQLDFKHDSTNAKQVDVVRLGAWIGMMVKKVRGLNFGFPCEVYVSVTDATHLYQDTNDDLVALGEEEDGSDHPVVIIMGRRGCLVQVGQTGF